MGLEVTALGVARYYAGLIDIFVMDHADSALCADVEKLGMRPVLAPILMRTDADRVELARFCVAEVSR